MAVTCLTKRSHVMSTTVEPNDFDRWEHEWRQWVLDEMRRVVEHEQPARWRLKWLLASVAIVVGTLLAIAWVLH